MRTKPFQNYCESKLLVLLIITRVFSIEQITALSYQDPCSEVLYPFDNIGDFSCLILVLLSYLW